MQEARVLKKLFSTSGIRGVFGEEITADFAYSLGKAIAGLSGELVVACDTRISSPALKHALVAPLLSAGAGVVDLGIAPTPVLCHASRHLFRSESPLRGVMITASHNPPQYNGFKLWNSEGMAIESSLEKAIEEKLSAGIRAPAASREPSALTRISHLPSYIESALSLVESASPLNVLVDPANGAAFEASPKLLSELGHRVTPINNAPDGSFPNRMPEPTPKNLEGTARIVREKRSDLAICHDGDADRMMPVDDRGRVADFDKFLVFLAENAVSESSSSKIVTTVDASMALESVIPQAEIIRTPVGDTFVARELKRTNAAFGGEPSGSFIFPRNGLWPDGLFAAAKTLQYLSESRTRLSLALDSIPDFLMVRRKLACKNTAKHAAMEELKSLAPESADASFVDGIRIAGGDWAVLVRPSGTEPCIRINTEAKDRETLKALSEKWESKLRQAIKKAENEKKHNS